MSEKKASDKSGLVAVRLRISTLDVKAGSVVNVTAEQADHMVANGHASRA